MHETLIDFMRHGEPSGGRRYRGSAADDPLTEEGWMQMWLAVGETCPWQRIITSPLERCRAFAHKLADRHGLPLAADDRFREVGMGAWEGRSPADVRKEDSAAYLRYYSDPVRGRPRSAERLEELLDRVGKAYDQIVESHPGQHILIVSHAGVMRAMLGHVLKAEPNAWYRAQVDYAAVSRFRHDAYGSRLEFHNRPRLA